MISPVCRFARRHHRGRDQIGAALDLDIDQLPALFRLVNFIADQRFQIGVGNGLLLVGQILEAMKDLFQILPCPDGSPFLPDDAFSAWRPLCLPNTKLTLSQPNGRRVHDLIGALVLEHAVLVDAGLVGKGIGADDGLVGLDNHAGIAADHVAGAVDFLSNRVRLQPIDRLRAREWPSPSLPGWCCRRARRCR